MAGRESKFWRLMLSFYIFGGVIGISNNLFGRANEQPWWGVVITLTLATLASVSIWRTIRVYEV